MLFSKGPVFDAISFVSLMAFMIMGEYGPEQVLDQPNQKQQTKYAVVPDQKRPRINPAPWPKPPDIERKQDWGQDPFQPPGFRPKPNPPEPVAPKTTPPKPVTPKPTPPPPMALTGILYQSNKQTAIINNTVMRVGDMVGHMEITDIQRNRVILKQGPRKYLLKLGRPLQQISQSAPAPEIGNLFENYENLTEAKSEIAQLSQEKNSLQKKIADLEKKLTNLKTELTTETNEKNNYRQQLDKVANKLNAKFNTLSGESAEAKGQNIILKSKATSLENRLKEEIEAKTTYLTQLKEASRKITALDSRFSQLKNDFEIEQIQKNIYEQQVQELASEKADRVSELITLRGRLTGENKLRVGLEEELTKQSIEKTASLNQSKELARKISQINRDNINLARQNTNLSNNTALIQDALRKERGLNSNYLDKIKDAQRSISNLEHQLIQIETDHRKNTAALRQNDQSLTTEIKAMRE
ncbi:MAG: hypothetical protein KAS70_04910, partial [Planctomycetes bacterium]|nr:hypothetical protein [Planctomycetota bacterium]